MMKDGRMQPNLFVWMGWIDFLFGNCKLKALGINVFIQQKCVLFDWIMFWSKQKSLRKIEKICQEVRYSCSNGNKTTQRNLLKTYIDILI